MISSSKQILLPLIGYTKPSYTAVGDIVYLYVEVTIPNRSSHSYNYKKHSPGRFFSGINARPGTVTIAERNFNDSFKTDFSFMEKNVCLYTSMPSVYFTPNILTTYNNLRNIWGRMPYPYRCFR
jgi:hypothetical protein